MIAKKYAKNTIVMIDMLKNRSFPPPILFEVKTFLVNFLKDENSFFNL